LKPLVLILVMTMTSLVLAEPQKAVPTSAFLDSVGIVTTFPDRGQPIDKTIDMVNYCGFRWVRSGIEGLSENGPTTLQTLLDLHKATGVKFNFGLVSGGTKLDKLLAGAKVLAEADALAGVSRGTMSRTTGASPIKAKKAAGRRRRGWPSPTAKRHVRRREGRSVFGQVPPVWSISENGRRRKTTSACSF